MICFQDMEIYEMHYTEIFWQMVKKADQFLKSRELLKDEKAGEIKTLGLGPCWYENKHTIYLYKENLKVENLDNDDFILGGHLSEYDYSDTMNPKIEKYTRREGYPKISGSNDILILSRVGEHLFDFHRQLASICIEGIARHAMLILPDMDKIFERLVEEKNECVKRGCSDFKFHRSVIEILSIGYSAKDKHWMWTSPDKFEYLCNPIMHLIEEIQIVEKEIDIHGYPHFVVYVTFVKQCNQNQNIWSSIKSPYGYKYLQKSEYDRGVYYLTNGVWEKVSNIGPSLDAIFETSKELRQADLILFNRILTQNNDLEFNLYSISPNIRPRTKIIIVEDDMTEAANNMVKLLENVEEEPETYNQKVSEEFWNVNSIIFGPSFAYMYKTFQTLALTPSYQKEMWIDPETVEMYMTQEGFFKLEGVRDVVIPGLILDVVPEFLTRTPFEFMAVYTRK